MDNLYQYINIFNENFKCDDIKEIIELYKKKKIVTSILPDSKNIKISKYQHPLFLNYNQCFFLDDKLLLSIILFLLLFFLGFELIFIVLFFIEYLRK